MKIFIALLLTIFSVNSFAQGYVDAKNVVKTQIKEYGAFVNGSSSTLSVGMAVCLDLADDNGIHVDLCYAEGAKSVGIVVNACNVGASCKIQTKGFFALGKFDYLATAAVAGALLYADTDGDIVRPATVTVAMFPIGVSLDAASADGSLEIYID